MQTTHQDWEPSHDDVLRIKDFGFEEESLFWHQEGRCSDPPQHPNISSEQDWIQPEWLCKWSDKWWAWEHLRRHRDRPTCWSGGCRPPWSGPWRPSRPRAWSRSPATATDSEPWCPPTGQCPCHAMVRNLMQKLSMGKDLSAHCFYYDFTASWWPQLMLYVSSS